MIAKCSWFATVWVWRIDRCERSAATLPENSP